MKPLWMEKLIYRYVPPSRKFIDRKFDELSKEITDLKQEHDKAADIMQMQSIEQRKLWLDSMIRIVDPVLINLSEGNLKENLPLYLNPDRSVFAPLEAFGRVSCGIAPWLNANLEQGEESVLQSKYRDMYLNALDRATNPKSKDYMKFDGNEKQRQSLVDAAFLCQGLFRAKGFILNNIDAGLKKNLISALHLSREIIPWNSNWLLFGVMVEAALFELESDCNWEIVRSYVARVLSWYKGDGIYGDGPENRCDYYNSYVIHPMLLDIVPCFKDEFSKMSERINLRSQRYGEILERMISPEGAYPMVGRSLCYRFGCFHLLSYNAWKNNLGTQLKPAQVRCALSAVINRTMSDPAMFDKDGWLCPGATGYQPELAENYINIGSLYLCTAVFCALGICGGGYFGKRKMKSGHQKKFMRGKVLL